MNKSKFDLKHIMLTAASTIIALVIYDRFIAPEIDNKNRKVLNQKPLIARIYEWIIKVYKILTKPLK